MTSTTAVRKITGTFGEVRKEGRKEGNGRGEDLPE